MAAPNHSGCDSPHAAAVVPADPVTGFLLSRGLQTDIAYLGESAFELGRRVRFAGLDLIYRFEQGTLLICDIAAYEESGVSPPNSPGSPYSPDSPARPRAPGDVGGAMRTLVSLIHAIERSVPEVETVEGRVPLMGGKAAKAANAVDEGDGGEVDERQLGRRLLSLYCKLGAQCGPDDDAGMVRVRYRMRGGTRQGRPAPP